MPGHAVFDDFRPTPARTTGEHVFDFVGTATRVSFKRGWSGHAQPAGRTVNPAEPPKNEHYLDWIALLTAVGRAEGTFRMAELGAGWAPWLIRGAFAARQRPSITALELLGVEADPTHHRWMIQHFEDNGVDPRSHHLLHGAVSGTGGTARFPVVEDPDVTYGASLAAAARAPSTIEVRSYTIPELLDRFTGPVDFLHIDIQGAEYDAVPQALDDMTARVKSIMIGTHQSDPPHDRLVATIQGAGWREVLNLPRKRTHATPWGEIAVDDGFLLFDNPNLLN